jgi:hypothetical protein
MEQVASKRIVPIRNHYCLECNETRGSAVTIEELKQDADIRLYFPACGHSRTLTADEKKRMREAFAAEGLI